MVFLWVALYGAVHMAFQRFCSGLTGAAMLLYTALLMLWLWRVRGLGWLKLPGLEESKSCGFFLPLLTLPVYHLLTGGTPGAGWLLMVSVSVAEELFFRGWLLKILGRRRPLTGILLSALAFGLFHGVNLLRGAELGYTLMQMLCGIAVGVCFAAVAVRTGSLLIGILVHFLINITAPGSSGAWLWCCVLSYGIYGLALCINISKEIPGETDTPGPTQFF